MWRFLILPSWMRNLYAGPEATVRTGHGTTDWFQIGKGVHQGCHHCGEREGRKVLPGFVCFLPWLSWPHLSSWHSVPPPGDVGHCRSPRASGPAWRFFPNPESRALRSSSCLARKPPRAPQLKETPETPPSSRGSPGGGHGNPLLYSCLENPMDRGAWQVTVHGVTKSWT